MAFIKNSTAGLGAYAWLIRISVAVGFILLLMLRVPFVVCAQNGPSSRGTPSAQNPQSTSGNVEENSDITGTKAETVLVVPVVPEDAPRYTGLLLTKLVEQNFKRTEVLSSSVLSVSSEAAEQNKMLAQSLSTNELVARLVSIGEQKQVRYVAAGKISKNGAQYEIALMVVNTEEKRMVVSSEKIAVGLEDVDRVVMDITEEFIASEFPVTVQKKVQEIRKTEAEEDAELREELADLEDLAEQDPEQAIKKLPKKVQKAVAEKAKEQAKEEARKEVVQEEIQDLYEKEKQQKQEALARKIQKYSLFGLYGIRIAADVLDAVSVQSRMQETQYWGFYMLESEGMYDLYDRINERSRSQTTAAYINGAIAGAGLASAHWFYYPNIFTITPGGRSILAVSQAMYTLGAMGTLSGGYLGIESMIDYSSYQAAEYSVVDQSGIDDAYEDYRESHSYYSWTQLGAYSLQAAGMLGTAAAFIWPGTREPLFLTAAGQKLVSIGNLLYGAAGVARNVALNYAVRETEERISAKARGVHDNNNTAAAYYETVAISSGVTALSLYTASVVTTVWGLLKTSGRESRRTDSKNFFWGFVPYGYNGVSLSFSINTR